MTPTRRATLLAVIVLAVAAVCFFAEQIHSRLFRSQHNPKRSYIVHSATMMDYDTGSQFNAFRYAFSHEDVNSIYCPNLGLECRIDLVNRDGKQLQRWGNAPVLAGTAGTITIRASLKDGKIQCQVNVVPNIPGIQTKLTASPKKWEGGLSSSGGGYMTILGPQHLSSTEPHKALNLMQYDDGSDCTLRIMVRFVYHDRDWGKGSIPPG